LCLIYGHKGKYLNYIAIIILMFNNNINVILLRLFDDELCKIILT